MKKLFPLALLIFISCKKQDPISLSSEKSISSVTFKAIDNPGLANDISATLLSDSIRFDFPQNITVNHLIPTIDFNGKKIDPANKQPQDFTNGVKYTVTAEDGTSKTYFFTIARISSDTSSLILGTWKLIKDSVSNNNYVNPSGDNLIPGVYIGTSVDYWRFDPNGVFSAQENGVSGSTTYRILAGNKLEIPIWSTQYGTGTFETINNSLLTVYFSATSSNGGTYYRKVYLKR